MAGPARECWDSVKEDNLRERSVGDEEAARNITEHLSSAVDGTKLGTDSPWAREFAAWGSDELGLNEKVGWVVVGESVLCPCTFLDNFTRERA